MNFPADAKLVNDLGPFTNDQAERRGFLTASCSQSQSQSEGLEIAEDRFNVYSDCRQDRIPRPESSHGRSSMLYAVNHSRFDCFSHCHA